MKLTEREISEIRQASERCGVQKLILFGSALRPEDFTQDSDIDLAVTFNKPTAKGRFTAYMDLKEALEVLFHRTVDLVSADAIRNPIFREELQSSGKILYAASA